MYHVNLLQNKRILCSLFMLIFFQNAFVLSIAGGSIKWYELASILVLFYLLISITKLKMDRISLLLFLLFVMSPIVSDVYSLCMKSFEKDVYVLYFQRFPHAVKSLRTNYSFSMIYSLVLSLGCFAVLYFIIHSDYLFVQYKKVVKYFLYTGTVVGLYSLYQFFGMGFLGYPDIVPSLLDARNYRGAAGHRAGGFSIEPGAYVVIQSIVVLYLIIDKSLFSRQKRKFLLTINLLALLCTLSSSMLIFFFSLGIYLFFFSKNRIARCLYICVFIILVLVFPVANRATDNLLQYVFITKIQNFVSHPNNTLDSGAMRGFTNGIGYKIFKLHPFIGCGFGNSFFYMPVYEYEMGIEVWGERLNASSTPQNNVSKILAEQGLLGFIPFIIFFICSIKRFFLHRTDTTAVLYFVITLFIFLCNFIAGVYLSNMFLWLNIALGLNYITHKYRH